MSNITHNPFQVPNSANLSDAEIQSYWVDLVDEGGFERLFRPTSLMPMIVLGGKGSGKTHLMRHFSFELQKIRSTGNIVEMIRRERYVGIYLRSSGLHASRFKRNGPHGQAWTNLFAFYIELWFTERLCAVISDIFPEGAREIINSKPFLDQFVALFDAPPFEGLESWNSLVSGLAGLRRKLDLAINNCFSDDPPVLPIVCSRGALIFGIPKLLVATIPEVFDGVVFTWLLDEYEHFHESAQQYINTLVREKQRPSTFKVGVRLWGIYTYKTFSNDEVLKTESEYEELALDERLRGSVAYPGFALSIVRRRLESAGWLGSDDDIRAAFENGQFLWEQSLKQGAIKDARPWMARLEKHLNDSLSSGDAPGVNRLEDIKGIIAALRQPNDPFVEKLNTFLLYRSWSKKRDLVKSASEICSESRLYMDGRGETEHQRAASKFKSDLLAQMRRSLQLSATYTGFDDFVHMSCGVARSLLVTLKKVYDEALYSGEQLFTGKPVSGVAQSRGVSGAAEWFFEDVLIYGEEGLRIRVATERLGRLFRALRYSEKPSECSLNSFSFDPNSLSAETLKLIDKAVRWSVLIPQENRSDRNSGMPTRLYRLSGMLCPKFDLPLSSRGNIALKGGEIDALFATDTSGSNDVAERAFTKIIDERVARCSPPFKALALLGQNIEQENDDLPDLFGGV
jgi:hypothetical protein